MPEQINQKSNETFCSHSIVVCMYNQQRLTKVTASSNHQYTDSQAAFSSTTLQCMQTNADKNATNKVHPTEYQF